MSIFFNSGKPMPETLADLERALLVDFEPVPDSDPQLYVFSGFGIAATVLRGHSMGNDLGIQFTDYDYHMQFHVVRTVMDPDLARQLQHYITLYAHDRMTGSLGYTSIVVDNLREQIQSHPTGDIL